MIWFLALRLACIFLAGKTEHSFVHSKDLLKCAGQYSNADIITAEAEVIEVSSLESLRVNLTM